MENRQIDSKIEICRLCGQVADEMIHIFGGDIPNLDESINKHLPITVKTDDTHPLTSCVVCTNTLLSFDQLVTTCIEAQKCFEELQVSVSNESSPSDEVKEEFMMLPESGNPITHDDSTTEDDQPNSDSQDVTRKKPRRKKHEIEAKFPCAECNNAYTRKYDLEKHMRLKHNHNINHTERSQSAFNRELISRCKIISDAEKPQYKCDICCKLFSQTFNLLRHYATHSESRDFCCHICGKSFKVADGLQRHIKVSHDKIKNVACNICELKFASKQGLAEHMNIHTNNRPFVCDVCGNAFRQRVTLLRHKLSHSPSNFKHECEVCIKMFKTAWELTAHRRSHAPGKPFQCTVCEMNFKYKNAMERHAKLHDETANFMCDICGKVLKQQRYLTEHKKIHI